VTRVIKVKKETWVLKEAKVLKELEGLKDQKEIHLQFLEV
jgi:hypothetical protein